MAVRIAHASIDENGKASGGKAGDQTTKEVCIRTWYNNTWNYVIRAKDSAMANKIATAMEYAAANNKIGYNQARRNTLLTNARKYGYDPSKVTAYCDTDCSALVSLACIYAGIAESTLVVGGNSATTSTLRTRLNATKKFDIMSDVKFTNSSDYLKRGDILLREGKHVVVVLDNGSKINPYLYNSVDYSRVFNAEFYAKKYPDVVKVYGNTPETLFKHFIEFGMKESRQGISTFNVLVYKKQPDLLKTFGNDMPKYYKHYCEFGYKENRKCF